IEPLDHRLSPLLISVGKDLGVGLGGELMPGSLQDLAQLEVVVDLAVLNDPNRGVFVVDRLVAAFDVDDREATAAEGHAIELDATFVVGPAMDHRVAHAADELLTLRRIPAGNPADPTHLLSA